jgi:hypothetical protein
MEDAGNVLAIRFFRPCPEVERLLAIGEPEEYRRAARGLAEAGYGLGRAWVAVYDGFCVVFNGYARHEYLGGHDYGDSVTCWMGQVLAYWLGVPYRRITLENNGGSDGTLWINGGCGVAVGDTDIEVWDLEIETYDDCCAACGCGLDRDDAYSYDGEAYCQECWDERFGYCARCGDPYCREDLVTPRDGEDTYCGYCIARECRRCAGCDEWYYEATYAAGAYYCEECLDELFAECAECGEPAPLDELREAAPLTPLCPTCFERWEEDDPIAG